MNNYLECEQVVITEYGNETSIVISKSKITNAIFSRNGAVFFFAPETEAYHKHFVSYRLKDRQQ
jgi:hypothetical protein